VAGVRAFNALYREVAGRRRGSRIVSPFAFFHPLDRLADWNRLYGALGFTQYQSVLPRESGPPAVARLFEALRRAGGSCYLAVIKDLAREGRGLLSFPRAGFTVALDLPLGPPATRLAIDAMNEVTLEAGGRIYLAKDLLTRADHFRAMEGERLAALEAARARFDPDRRLRSALSARLFGEPS
jgi:FAD/FMN-containing dehydrogenase